MRATAILLAGLLCAAVLQAPAVHAEDAHRAPAAAGPVFVPVAPLVVPVFSGAGQVRLHLYFVVQLAAGDADAGERIRQQMPRLRDAYLRALAGVADRMGDDSAMPDDERIKRTLNAASERVLGPHVVHEILIQRSFSRRAS